jgi:alpha-tubulin suppressor-like RCC1 family protein
VAGGLTFTSLAAGFNDVCGLTSAGTVYCWGGNSYGTVGDSTTTARHVPTLVRGGVTFSSISGSVGGAHVCGLTSAGAAYCWGWNSRGQLGNGDVDSHLSPDTVTGGRLFTTLTIGVQFSCGLTSIGTEWCWGDNDSGQLGDQNFDERHTPAQVRGGLVFTSVATRSGTAHSCALTAAGAAYCWGDNSAGQLGDGTTTGEFKPVAVTGGLLFASITAGGSTTCALTSTGAAYCWGANDSGALGDGTTTSRAAPVAVGGGLTFSTLVTSGAHSCGVTTAGAVYCWGNNDFGQLGDGTSTSRTLPVLLHTQ